MKLGIKHIASMALLLNIFVSGYLWAANSSNTVEVEGDRLSVHAEGMALGDLLMAVRDMTGVQFGFVGSVGQRKIFLDFEGLPLSEGIKKIILPSSFAAIYDEAGKLRRVLILETWKGSGMNAPREEESDPHESPQPGRRRILYSTRSGNSDGSELLKSSPLGKGAVHLDGTPVDRANSEKGSPDREDQVMDGPPVDRRYLVSGPQNPQEEKLEVPPDEGSTNSPVPPGSDSEGVLTEGPPLDRPYAVDGPPD